MKKRLTELNLSHEKIPLLPKLNCQMRELLYQRIFTILSNYIIIKEMKIKNKKIILPTSYSIINAINDTISDIGRICYLDKSIIKKSSKTQAPFLNKAILVYATSKDFWKEVHLSETIKNTLKKQKSL